MKLTTTFFLLMSIVNVCYCSSLELHTDVVLFGALGDLSKKYLWQSFFQLYLNEQNENKTFSFYGISRDFQEEGSKKLSKILDNVSCKEKIGSLCDVKLSEFRQLVKYVQLKTDDQFETFGKLNLTNEQKNPNQKLGRIFYLALPPNVYSSVAGKLSSCCKLSLNQSWSRLVLEKPFGSDLQSALSMAKEIGKYFNEEEIYRVDHYLAKSVVKQVLPFRYVDCRLLFSLNNELFLQERLICFCFFNTFLINYNYLCRNRNFEKMEPILNNEHIERIEIAMKEPIDIKGESCNIIQL